jgi:hypothetical protein
VATNGRAFKGLFSENGSNNPPAKPGAFICERLKGAFKTVMVEAAVDLATQKQNSAVECRRKASAKGIERNQAGQ